LRQLLLNLLSNALKYTPSGGVVRVRLRHHPSEGLVLEVTDTGIGIPPEELPHIFERFYRVDKSRTRSDGTDGLGLGLSIVRWIVEAHGGSIQVESQPGHGSCFRVLLPTEQQ
jgi:signal transduction histidine kinase